MVELLNYSFGSHQLEVPMIVGALVAYVGWRITRRGATESQIRSAIRIQELLTASSQPKIQLYGAADKLDDTAASANYAPLIMKKT